LALAAASAASFWAGANSAVACWNFWSAGVKAAFAASNACCLAARFLVAISICWAGVSGLVVAWASSFASATLNSWTEPVQSPA
jgi:hypothetical protein